MSARAPDGVADVRITRDDSAESQRAAANIWAGATAKRDGLLVPAAAEEKLPGIQHRLSTSTGSLHVAYLRGEPAGFALVVTHESALELVYLAVAPEAWGAGIGGSLLTYVDDLARVAGVGCLELWVIDDNERAVRVYERSGWKPTEDLKASAGRLERRLVKELSIEPAGIR
ncbi:MAG TPA: GNAT family N-acetyltransferase [Actinoplanes sp.]|nr:GNAT family N-acetyltransferase [Actinoplanes sp.]